MGDYMFWLRRLLIVMFFFTAPLLPASQEVADQFVSIMSIIRFPATFQVFASELQLSKVCVFLEKNEGNIKYTCFAPTDAAFNQFGKIGVLRGTPLYEEFLKFHILPGLWTRKKIQSNRTAKTMATRQLNLREVGKILYSIETDNGILHIIEKVLIHPDVKKKLDIK